MLRIGIDVGGTNTDAVLMEANNVLATAKATTTTDTVSGFVQSMQRLRAKASKGFGHVQGVMLGTTQFVNAVIEQKSMCKVFVIRLCGTSTAALPPFSGMPHHLAQSISAGYLLANGGYEYDGATEITPLQASSDAGKAAEMILQAGAQSAVICGVHSPLNPSQELDFASELASRLLECLPGLPVYITLSHKLSGRLGLLEREAASILNASLQPLAAAVIPQYGEALKAAGLHQAPLYLTGNDGTLLSAETAQQYPVLTFKSGPVNSVRGAAYLAGLQDALVCDIGGTTTDIGSLVKGMPRMCGTFVDICGVCTNFQMPDVTSFGLGGGSLVAWDQVREAGTSKQQQKRCYIGPSSVGSALTSSCLVYGGDQATASDVAVLLHDRLPDLVTRQAALSRLQTLDGGPAGSADQQKLQIAWDTIQQKLAAAVDAAKQSAAPVALVAVGGGAGLCGDSLPGVSSIIRPQHADVANAIGAAIPQVAGTVDTLLHLNDINRQQQLAAVIQQATAAAVEAGAEPDSCEVVEMEGIPVAYGSAGATRVHIKVAGKLQLNRSPAVSTTVSSSCADHAPVAALTSQEAVQTVADAERTIDITEPMPAMSSVKSTPHMPAEAKASQQDQPEQQHALAEFATPNNSIQLTSDEYHPGQHYSLQHLQQYKPSMNSQGFWEVSDMDLDAMAVGAQVLGAGGGGSARHNRLKLQHAMTAQADSCMNSAGSRLEACRTAAQTVEQQQHNQQHTKAPLIISLKDLQDDAYVCDVGGMGAPTVSAEKLDSCECSAAVRGLSAALPRPITALLCAEVGGGNALEPLAVGLEQALPVVDADLMGRAFPELQMSTAAIAGVSLTPAAVADDKGNVLIMSSAAAPNWAEKILRAACTEMGCTVGLASSPMTGTVAKQVVVPDSLSLAWRIGMAVLCAQAAKTDPIAAILDLYQGTARLVFQGKVVDVVRHSEGGFVRGYMRITSQGKVWQLAQRTEATAAQQILDHWWAQNDQNSDATADSSSLMIEFQNENLLAKSGSCTVGCVPDLICVLETNSGLAVATEDVRYGLRVSVVVLPAHPLLRTPAALDVVGPAAFGYAAADGVVYNSVGPYPDMPTVHDLYCA